MTLEEAEEMSDEYRRASLRHLLAVMPMAMVASVIAVYYDSEDELNELATLITTEDLPEADME